MTTRVHEAGPLTRFILDPGAITVEMTFDRPDCVTDPHVHTFGHAMRCKAGAGVATIAGRGLAFKAGDVLDVPAGVEHAIPYAVQGTVIACRHEHPDIDPAKVENGSIPLEWLTRLTVGGWGLHERG